MCTAKLGAHSLSLSAPSLNWLVSHTQHVERSVKWFAAHAGYFWLMTGGIYFGGRLWHEESDDGKLYYSSGRFESDPKYVVTSFLSILFQRLALLIGKHLAFKLMTGWMQALVLPL